MKTQSSQPGFKIGAVKGRWKWQIFGLLMGVVLTLSLSSDPGWIIRRQVHFYFEKLGFNQDQIFQIQTFQLRHPDDFAIQVAAGEEIHVLQQRNRSPITTSPPQEYVAQYLWYPEDQFADGIFYDTNLNYNIRTYPSYARSGQNPIGLAEYLRTHAGTPILETFRRQEVQELIRHSSIALYSDGPSPYEPIQPVGAGVYDETTRNSLFEYAARDGEASDPDNAFFPMMLALAHFSENRDDLGFGDLDRATHKRFWDNYAANIEEARWQIDSSLSDQEDFIGNYFKHTIQINRTLDLRIIASLVISRAIRLEQDGNIDGGIALRTRICRLAALVAGSAPNNANTLQTIPLFQMAFTTPGCRDLTRVLTQPNNLQAPSLQTNYARIFANEQHIQSEYISKLKKLGYTEEAEWTSAQMRSLDRISDRQLHDSDQFLSQMDETKTTFRVQNTQMDLLNTYWKIAIFVLAQIGLCGLLGGMLSVRSYRHRFRVIDHGYWSRREWLAVLRSAGMVILLMFLIQNTFQLFEAKFLMLCLLSLAGLVRFLLSRIWGQSQVMSRGFDALCITLLIATYLVWSSQGTLKLFTGWPHQYSSNINPLESIWRDIKSAFCINLPMIFLPTIYLYYLIVANRVRNQPVARGIAEGFRAILLPTISFLLVVYVTIILTTYKEEHSYRERLKSQFGIQYQMPME